MASLFECVDDSLAIECWNDDNEEPPLLVTDSSDDEYSDDSLLAEIDSDSDINFPPRSLLSPALSVGEDDGSEPDLEPEPPKPQQVAFVVVGKRKLGTETQFECGRPTKRLNDKTVPYCGLDNDTMYALLHFAVPWQLFHMIAIMFHIDIFKGTRSCMYDCVEYFCGRGMVHKSMMESYGFNVKGYDIAHGKDEDLNSPRGWITALLWCLRIHTEGLAWLGTVCSSWVCVCRASTRRSLANPRGDLRSGSVREGNRHAARSAAIAAICYSRMVTWILEQPLSSLLPCHPALMHIQRRAVELGKRFLRIDTYQGAFAAETLKPTMLLSSNLCIQAMIRPHPGHAVFDTSRTCLKGTSATGRKTYTGNKDELKATQTYSREFGIAVTEMYARRSDYQKHMANTIFNAEYDIDEDPWEDADFDEPLEWLKFVSITGQATRQVKALAAR